MGNEDYSAVVGGGLKLKGGKPTGVVKKKKKKDKEKDKERVQEKAVALEDALSTGSGSEIAVVKSRSPEEAGREYDKEGEEEAREGSYDHHDGKTEAERKHEEMRRKRVCLYFLATFLPHTAHSSLRHTYIYTLPLSMKLKFPKISHLYILTALPKLNSSRTVSKKKASRRTNSVSKN
jgi:protein FAM32A